MGEFVLNPDTAEARPMKSKGLDRLEKDDLVSLRMPGAGGYGDPGKRDRNRLLRDVRDGKVSVESAQRDYGVEVTSEMLSDLD
jgi:N-methylhydantoinase B